MTVQSNYRLDVEPNPYPTFLDNLICFEGLGQLRFTPLRALKYLLTSPR